MKKEIVKIGINVILGIVIGFLLCPVINKPEITTPVGIVPDSTSMSSVPDTIWREVFTYVPEKVVVYNDTGSTKIIYSDIGLQLPEPTEIFWAYEEFNPNDYTKSEVFVAAPDSVYLIQNNVVVQWDKYVTDNVMPEINIKTNKVKKNSLIKGLAAGAVLVAGVATGDWRIAAGGAVAAGGIVIFF